ncbi:MAG: hypothetical protein QM768_13410 [Agriterribacter sp.]
MKYYTNFFLLMPFFSCTRQVNNTDHEFFKKILETEASYLQYSIHDNGSKFVLNTDDPSSLRTEDDIHLTINEFSEEIKGKLIFRFTELNCETCVDATLSSMKRIMGNDQLRKSVIILTSYKFNAYYKDWKRSNNIEFDIYNLGDIKLPLLSESLVRPYLFYLDDSLKIQNVFFPIKEYAYSTDQYLSFISKKL